MASVKLALGAVTLLMLMHDFGCAADELLAARCESRCLHLLEQRADIQGEEVRRRDLKHNIFELCDGDANCSSCSAACVDLYDMDLELCKTTRCATVASVQSCADSCQFQRHIAGSKAGTCPNSLPEALALAADQASGKLTSEQEPTGTLECVTSCQHDADCSGTLKCCSNGCGWSCMRPDLHHAALGIQLPHRPAEVQATERKRGRSAIVRWTLKSDPRETLATYSTVYVVQWRWAVSQSPGPYGYTRWQVISKRNKPYAILKHLLSPGRYYQFRVAAVNDKGTVGYSEVSPVFKLSKDPKPPNKPRDLVLGARAVNEDGTISQEIHWRAPSSDLPIVHYQVSWTVDESSTTTSSGTQNDMAARNQLPRDLTGGQYDTELIPAELNGALLKSLQPDNFLPPRADKKYKVSVQAIVEGEIDEKTGAPAIIELDTDQLLNAPATATPPPLFIEPESVDSRENAASVDTAQLTEHVTTTTKTAKPVTSTKEPLTTKVVVTERPDRNNDIDEIHLIASPNSHARFLTKESDVQMIRELKVDEPYFQNGLIKADISWDLVNNVLLSTGARLEFEVAWWPTVCLDGAHASRPEYTLIKPLVATTEITQFSLYDLQFSCQFQINVTSIIGGLKSTHTAQTELRVPICGQTPVKGDVKPTCPNVEPAAPKAVGDLKCDMTGPMPLLRQSRIGKSSALLNLTAICTWQSPTAEPNSRPVVGYRVITGRKLTGHNFGMANVQGMASIDQNTVAIKVLPAGQHVLTMDALLPDAEYIVQVQPMSEVGFGPAVQRLLRTPPLHKSKSAMNYAENSKESGLDTSNTTRSRYSWLLMILLTFVPALAVRWQGL